MLKRQVLSVLQKSPHRGVLLLALLLATGLSGGCAGPSNKKIEVTHIHATFRVHVDEHGIVKSAELLDIVPAVSMTDRAVRDLISMHLLGKTFTPDQVNGKPVAGYLTIPVDIDFDSPVPLNGM